MLPGRRSPSSVRRRAISSRRCSKSERDWGIRWPSYSERIIYARKQPPEKNISPFSLQSRPPGGHLVRLTDVTVSIGSAAQYAHLTGLRPVSLTATRTFQDLRSFIFSDHPLELHKKLIFRAVALWRLHEHRLDSVVGELLDQQNLVRILAAQAVRGIREQHLDLPFSGEVPHALQAGPLQRGSAIAFIFEDPFFGYLQIVALGELDQRRRLARDRVLLALLLGRHSCVDYCHPHRRTPSHAPRRGARDMAPEFRMHARASARASDQTNRKLEFEMRRDFDAVQPCFFRTRRNAFSALATIAPMVRPLLLAYLRSSSTVRGGSFKVIGTVASGTSIGRPSWEASCR